MKMTDESPETMRLQKFLARSGVASRRGSEKLIAEGHIAVNGNVVTEMGHKVHPQVDTICVDGIPVRLEEDHVTLMLNKPAGYLTAMKDDRNRPCVAELVPCDRYPALYPIGRLDFDTTGLLLFSTDGEMGNKLLHPSRHVDKTYEAVVRGIPTQRDINTLQRGVKLDDGVTAPAQVKVVRRNTKQNQALIRLTIHEGKKRQVKRMCAAVGHPVEHLHRSKFGSVELGNLPEGQWRLLTDEEVAALAASGAAG